ncbi:MAG: CYTH domain-containing protein, partial [Clostridiales bacterium]|nr:CYTH domain-containing protein [Candidatus Apopatousia equi]
IDRSYYLIGESDFGKVRQVMSLMPSFQVGNISSYEYTDAYFETPEYFLREINATVRVRKEPTKQTLSIVCNNLGERREFETEMKLGDDITDDDKYLLFLEDKIQSIYTHKLDVDVIRVLHHLKPFLTFTTNRKVHEILDNREFKAEVDFDTTYFHTKRNDEVKYIIEIKPRCFLTQENEASFERFVREIEKRVVMIPMGEKKLDAGMRVFKREW